MQQTLICARTVSKLLVHYLASSPMCFGCGSYFRVVQSIAQPIFPLGSNFRGFELVHIIAETQFLALSNFSHGSYFRVSKMVLIFAGTKIRENMNTRSLKPRNGEPCELFDVYSISHLSSQFLFEVLL